MLFELCHVYFLTWANEVKKKPLHAKADCSKGTIWTPELSVRNMSLRGYLQFFRKKIIAFWAFLSQPFGGSVI